MVVDVDEDERVEVDDVVLELEVVVDVEEETGVVDEVDVESVDCVVEFPLMVEDALVVELVDWDPTEVVVPCEVLWKLRLVVPGSGGGTPDGTCTNINPARARTITTGTAPRAMGRKLSDIILISMSYFYDLLSVPRFRRIVRFLPNSPLYSHFVSDPDAYSCPRLTASGRGSRARRLLFLSALSSPLPSRERKRLRPSRPVVVSPW